MKVSILDKASFRFFSELANEILKNPSPYFPKHSPANKATPASSRSLLAKTPLENPVP